MFGILERQGDLFTRVVLNASRKSLIPEITRFIARGTRVTTDEWRPYKILTKLGYDHQTVQHSAKEYVRGDVHVNGLEGFWGQLKQSIKGTHIHVSPRYLPLYLGEFEYRYNRRKRPETMFAELLSNL